MKNKLTQSLSQLTEKKKIIIYTDGSSRGNPGPGGYGAIIVFPEQVIEIGDQELQTTNNAMELSAIYYSLQTVLDQNYPKTIPITIYTDSSYVINGITKWVNGWEQNGWITSTKTPVINSSLWKRLLIVTRKFSDIQWAHVRGHRGIWGNERCDQIATAFADGKSPALFHGPVDRYEQRIFVIPEKTVSSKKEPQKKESKKAYAYIAMIGKSVRTFSDWESCKNFVYGKNAKYKKVFSEQEKETTIAQWKSMK